MPYKCLTIVLAAILVVACGPREVEEPSDDAPKDGTSRASALDAVNRRIDAFNRHDVDSYLTAHHENVQIYEYPQKSIGEGRSHLNRIFGPLLEQGIGSIEVVHQVAIEQTVVSEEIISYAGAPIHIVVIYTVDNNLISSFRLIEPDE